MIITARLTPADVGREVIYLSHGQAEYGWLKHWNSEYLFVQYVGSGGRGIATRAADCDFTQNAEPVPEELRQ